MQNQRLAFSKRLREILPDLGIDPDETGYQTKLGETFKHRQQSAHQWLNGESMPKPHVIDAMAQRAKVELAWLQFGRGNKYVSVRPKVKDLMRIGEELADYKIDQLIKIGAALDEPDPHHDNHHHDNHDPPARRRNG